MPLVTLIPYLRDLFRRETVASHASTWISIDSPGRSARFRICRLDRIRDSNPKRCLPSISECDVTMLPHGERRKKEFQRRLMMKPAASRRQLRAIRRFQFPLCLVMTVNCRRCAHERERERESIGKKTKMRVWDAYL